MVSMQEDLPELFSLRTTSKILGVHPNTLRQWDKKGILKAVRYGERKDRHFKKEDILRLIKKTKTNNHSEEVGQKKRSMKSSLRRLSSLQRVTAALVKASSLRDIADVVVDQGAKALHAVSGALFLYAETEDCLVLIDSRGYPEKIIEKLKKLPLRIQIPTSDAQRKGTLILVETYEECMLRYPTAVARSFALTNKAFAAIPITVNEKVIGVLSFSFKDNTHFSKDDIKFMLTIVEQFTNAYLRVKVTDLFSV